jgi:hypothetical protein
MASFRTLSKHIIVITGLCRGKFQVFIANLTKTGLVDVKMSKKSIEPVEIPPIYFEVHLKILFYLGIDILPIQNTSMRFIFYSYSIFIIGLMCVFTITEFLDMVLNFEDIYKMTLICSLLLRYPHLGWVLFYQEQQF